MENIIWEPRKIEEKSMEIIEQSIDKLPLHQLEKAVVKRIVHTTGDFEIAPYVKFSPGAAEKGAEAIKKGASVYTDVNMLAAGISKKALEKYGGGVYCSIASEEVIKMAKETGKTRASTAMRLWGEKLDGQVVAIGNAPTALFELLKMVEEGVAFPALVVGTPVGFVGAAESKEALMASDIPYVSIPGTRGGSTIAAAAVNAILYFKDDNNA
ncbi:MAG: precorrin-8X/cobalt-precorrin-8 methylmutase [Clostridia bacterium]|nr:cobH [Clostridiales bacterium]MDK2984862.1 precorrin-8X/cobalt-precorrin-8 methylmutase [Clostridia bacterium]